MVYNRECVTCKFLEACSKTSTQKLLSHFVCDTYERVINEEQIVKARCYIINIFGNAGIDVLAPHKKDEYNG